MQTFRNRIGVLTWVTGLLLAVQPVFQAPQYVLTWHPFGSPLTILIGQAFWLGALLMIAIMTGTQWVLAAWDIVVSPPAFVRGVWTLPLAMSWIALRLLPRQATRGAWLALFAATLLLLAMTLYSLAKALGGAGEEYPASFILRTLVFATAGTLYLWLYSVGERSLLTATQMLVGSYLLAVAFWQPVHVASRLRWLYGLVLGLIIGQMAWLFRHVGLSSLQGGLLLLLVFYGLAVIFERYLEARLTNRLLLELFITGLMVVFVVMLLSP